MSLTGVEDLDGEILLWLDLGSLAQCMTVSLKFYESAKRESLWGRKVQQTYGDEIVRAKSPTMTFYDQYRNLHRIKAPNVAAQCGFVDVLTHLKSLNKNPTKYALTLASRKGHINVLEWLISNGFEIDKGLLVANAAIGNNHVELAEWFLQRGFVPDEKGADTAAKNGHILALTWLETLKILPTRSGMQEACYHGRIPVLEWMILRGFKLDRKSANRAAQGNQLGVINWLAERRILPDRKGANHALRLGHVGVLEWMVFRDIVPAPNGDAIRDLVVKEKLPLLKQLAKHEILPDTKGMDAACGRRLINIVEWLLSKRVYPSEWGINEIYIKERGPIMQLLLEKKVLPTPGVYDHLEDITVEALSRFYDLGIVPSSNTIADSCLHRRKFPELQWLAERGIKPSQGAINRVFSSSGDHELLKNGFLPSTDVFNRMRPPSLETLKLFGEHKILPKAEIVREYLMREMIPELDWLAQRGIVPDRELLHDVMIRGHVNSMLWLIAKRIVDPEVALLMGLINNYFTCLDALSELGIRPSLGLIYHVLKVGFNPGAVAWLVKQGFLKEERKNGEIHLSLNV